MVCKYSSYLNIPINGDAFLVIIGLNFLGLEKQNPNTKKYLGFAIFF